MTRRCYLHVGSPKTGTSYLQNVLWQSRDELASQGVELPLRRNDHFLLTLALRDEYDARTDPARGADVVDRLVEAVAAAERDVLVTHELLAVVTQERVDAFLRRLAQLDDLELHVVVTTRSLDRQLPSEWQQFVKTRHTGGYPHFLKQVRTNPDHRFWHGQDFAAIAARWGGSLPPSQVHVVTVPPGGAPPDELLRRFCSVIGVDASRLDADVERDNASIGYEQAELLRRLNTTLGPRLRSHRAAYARVVKFFYAEQVLARQPGQRLVLPAADHDWCAAASRDQADRITAAGYDVVGDVADLLPRWPEQEPAALSADDRRLLEVSLEATAALLERHQADLATIRGLRQDLRRARRHGRPGAGPAPTGLRHRLAPLVARLRSRRSRG